MFASQNIKDVKVLPHKRQYENGLYQRANTMSATFFDTASVQGGSNAESVEQIIDLAENANVYLSLGVDRPKPLFRFIFVRKFFAMA